eukprot:TRINITY_DN58054_c0_g1_i1.p2 TRINITY_DN58054_c0_g1~~TRINITY_DN58054_c0_g1_i1.p2  ORF type:complete len:158 (-),score=31.82 TRINITY_DN58054_c0_g1_i1:100-525(-)
MLRCCAAIASRGGVGRILQPPLRTRLLAPSAVRDFGDRRGRVKRFVPEFGHGIILSEGKEYFVYHTGITSKGLVPPARASLEDGEVVEFDVAVDPEEPGRQIAVRVTGPGGSQVRGSSRLRNDVYRAQRAKAGVQTTAERR